jgi:hypothetical protein
MACIWLFSLKNVVKVKMPLPKLFWVASEEGKSQDLCWVIDICIGFRPETTRASESWDATCR